MVFQFGEKNQVVVPFDTATCLPILKAYKYATKSSKRFALVYWTTDEQNNNLTYLQKHLLEWKYRLVHLELHNLQWISRK